MLPSDGTASQYIGAATGGISWSVGGAQKGSPQQASIEGVALFQHLFNPCSSLSPVRD